MGFYETILLISCLFMVASMIFFMLDSYRACKWRKKHLEKIDEIKNSLFETIHRHATGLQAIAKMEPQTDAEKLMVFAAKAALTKEFSTKEDSNQ